MTTDSRIEAFLSHFPDKKKTKNGYEAKCPAHDDKRESLSIGLSENEKILLKCQAGCDYKAVLEAIGEKESILFPMDEKQKKSFGNIVAEYSYFDEFGKLLYQCVRFKPKDFRQRQPNGNGGWSWNLKGVRLVPYRLPELLSTNKDIPVLIVEGEKDVDNLLKIGLTATCNPMGAGKWRKDFSSFFVGKDVFIIPDNDSAENKYAGQKHAINVAVNIGEVAKTIKILELPNGKDVSEWIDSGGTKDILLSLQTIDFQDYSKKIAGLSKEIAEKKSKNRPREIDPNDKRPLIKWEGGELPKIVDEAEIEIIKLEGIIYQRGNLIVHPVRGKSATVRGLTRSAGGLAIVQIDIPYLTDILTKAIQWERFDQRSGGYVRINAPKQVAETLLSRYGRWKADPLIAIIETPTIRPDGSVLDKPGYDKTTGLYFDPGSCAFPEIPKKLTLEDALKSVSIFKELLSGFPFEADFDFSVALAAILTALIRRVLKSSPMFAFRAPKMGSGKSLLADVISLIGTGRTTTMMSATDDPEEEKKRLLSILMAGDSVICIDNVEKPYESDALSSILTQETWTNRILGTNKIATVPTCATWLMTGNNIAFVGDITTRVLPCNLDPQCERPEERDFSVNLYDYVPANRGRLACTGLTILKAYIEAGKPKQDFKQFGRFEEWSNLVRASLVWCGLADPCLSRKGLEDADPVRCQLKAVFSAWYKIFQQRTVSANEVIKSAEFWMEKNDEDGVSKYRPNENLFSALFEIAPEKHDGINHRRLGAWLKKHLKRIEGGYKLQKMEDKLGVATWRVVKMDEGKTQTKGLHGLHGFAGSHPYEVSTENKNLVSSEEKKEKLTVCSSWREQTHVTHVTHANDDEEEIQ